MGQGRRGVGSASTPGPDIDPVSTGVIAVTIVVQQASPRPSRKLVNLGWEADTLKPLICTIPLAHEINCIKALRAFQVEEGENQSLVR